MARDNESLKRMIVKLSEVGVKITKTKSRLEVLESVKGPHEISST
ncbi:Lmo0850 family protein [Jeotgalibacillus proteolyticus]|nr:Lmo0850 family protein [Jeotgalibacillus proteolyticus]